MWQARILLQVDGQRLNDMVYDQALIGTEFSIDMALTERIEYVPGPGSAIYGSSAFFGVINLITKKGSGLAGTEVALKAASDRSSARVTVGQRLASDGVCTSTSSPKASRRRRRQHF